ncbi:hypothetical protein HDU79_006036 [Rhizoclosmatium sp. JEL0117]|nr:hypothetical protein HDU79_006036 [Rhizoclosmatium sp. JEL0117]
MSSPTPYSSFKRTVHIPGNHALPPGISNQVAWELSYARSDPNDPSTPPSALANTHPEHQPQPIQSQDPTGVLQGLRVTERELQTLREWDKMLGGSSAVNAAAAMLFEASGGCGTSLSTNPGVKFGFTNGGGYLSPHVIQMQMLSRMYASTGAAAWGAGRRGKVRVPVGGWPSGVTGVEFGMGMKTIPLPPKDGIVKKVPEDVRGPLVGNAGASLQMEIRKFEKLDKEGELQLPDNNVVRAQKIESRQKSEVAAKGEFEKFLAAEAEKEKQKAAKEGDEEDEKEKEETEEANSASSPEDENIRWLEWAAALIANSNNMKAKQTLEPISHASTLEATQVPKTQPNIPHNPQSSNKRPQSARSMKARTLQPLQVPNSAPSSIGTSSKIPYAVNSPNPPPGPPGSADSIVVSNPAHLPLPYYQNRRFHSNPIHPDYLTSSDLPVTVTHTNPNFPQVYHKESIYMTEFSNRMQIPAKYVAAFNIAARVNGKPLAQAIPGTENVGGIIGTSLKASNPPTPNNQSLNYESTFGYGYGNVKTTQPSVVTQRTTSTGALLPPRRPRPPQVQLPQPSTLPLPSKGAPAILGPLVGSSKVLTSDDWQGFQGIQKGAGIEGGLKLVSGLSGRDGGEMYHGLPPCLSPELEEEAGIMWEEIIWQTSNKEYRQ